MSQTQKAFNSTALTIKVVIPFAGALGVMGLTLFFWLTGKHSTTQLLSFAIPVTAILLGMGFLMRAVYLKKFKEVTKALANAKSSAMPMRMTSKHEGFNFVVEFLDPKDASLVLATAKVRVNSRWKGATFTDPAVVYHMNPFGTGYVVAKCRGLTFFGEFMPPETNS